MNPLKIEIFGEVKKQFPEFAALDDVKLNNLIFHHPSGLRLSTVGYRVIKKILTPYSFELPNTIKSRHQFGLGQMTYPYYLTSKRIVLFSDMDAMVVKLHGGIQGFLETCSQL
jgi:hypothetical protein